MPYKERLTVLHEAEINDLYGVPSLSLEEKRISFTLNDLEQDVIKSIRDRNHKCYAIALLGYFKIKPIQLNPAYKELKADLTLHDVQTRPVCREEVETITGFRLSGEGDNRNQI